MSHPLVIITRTSPGGEAFAARLKASGYNAIASPLLTAEATGAPPPIPPDTASGYILTSTQALRFAPADLPKTTPVYAVGEATAQTAKNLGFTDVTASGGTVEALAETVRDMAPAGQLLHLAGFDLADGTHDYLAGTGRDIRQWPVYRTRAQSFDPGHLAADGPVFVTLHSPKAAQVFYESVRPYARTLPSGKMNVLCLSQAVLRSLPETGCGAVYAAKTPDEDALATLLATLTSGNGENAHV